MMNKDLERRLQKERRDKAAHARTIEEMRNEGASEAAGDLARSVKSERQRLKAERNVRVALKGR